DGLQCLLIAGPSEPFSEFELYQLDQALMQGTNLGIFLDGVSQQSNPQMQAMQQAPAFGPNRTGLEKLVSTYGVRVQEALVLDEHCYKQRLNQQMGGGERPIYFAPIIKNKNINHQLGFLHNIKGLVGLKHSPLQPLEQVLQRNTLDLQALFSSSERSWTLRKNINLNPMLLQPPQSEEDLSSRLLACLIQGEFPSHFAGQPIPEKEPENETGDGKETAGSPETGEQSAAAADLSRKIDTRDTRRNTGKPAKISLIGSSDLLSDSVVDQQGSSVNAVFLMNLLDELNGRTEMARLRSKVQQFNPIQETSSRTKMWIKTLTIAGLPCLVLLVGLLVWAARIRRKNHIRMLFSA
ncbi:MAG: GldG family protein, partial [Desulfohalobiaceae bacterium]|nr:GldG family protein [Desulfohalobiaceae bacterium]